MLHPFLFLPLGGRKAPPLAQDTTVTPNTMTFSAHLSVHPHILFRDPLISVKFHISWFSVVDAFPFKDEAQTALFKDSVRTAL
jgi:hypothetical protein